MGEARPCEAGPCDGVAKLLGGALGQRGCRPPSRRTEEDLQGGAAELVGRRDGPPRPPGRGQVSTQACHNEYATLRVVMKASVLLRVLAAGAGLAVGVAAAVWLVLWISLRSSAVRVPDVRTLDLGKAMAVVQDVGLVARTQDGVSDPDVTPGHVARQRPGGGYQLKRGGTVLLYPSLGQATQKVGDLDNLPISLVETELESEHLALGRRCEVEGEAEAAVVLAASPAFGSLVSPGSDVTLLINRAPRDKRYVMPDFVGAAEEDAARVIRALGFRLANVQRVAYPGMAPGIVLRQEPAAGGPVSETAITALWVSR